MDERTIRRLADLAVGFGADVYPDEIVAIGGGLGKADLVRAIPDSAPGRCEVCRPELLRPLGQARPHRARATGTLDYALPRVCARTHR